MAEPTERDREMAEDFQGEGWLMPIDRQETLRQLARYFAAAREEGRAEERERIAVWFEAQRPTLHGPNYGLASEDERRALRNNHRFFTDYAAKIRSGGVP